MSERAQALDAAIADVWQHYRHGSEDAFRDAMRRLTTVAREAPAEGVSPQPDLHAAIMNLRCVVPSDVDDADVVTGSLSGTHALAYKRGHRDARHAAAELAMEASAPVSPVEPTPEPPKCVCPECEPVIDPVPQPSEDDINRLEKAAWDSHTDLVLVWYRDQIEMYRRRLRETERAWQLERKRKPTGAPAPCVWRDIESAPKDGTHILTHHEEGYEICWWQDAQPDAPDDMGHDAGWFGSVYSFPGRSFGNPSHFSESQGQPTHWMPLPVAPLKGAPDDRESQEARERRGMVRKVCRTRTVADRVPRRPAGHQRDGRATP